MTRSLWLCVLALALGALVVAPGPAAAEPLFAGTSNSGIVYQYMGGTTWDAISPSLGYAVLTLTEYEGKLYAGTMSTSSPMSGVGKVWRYDGDGLWTLVGDDLDDQVCQLVVYNGDLYAGTAWAGGRICRYDGGTTWTNVVSYGGWSGMRALYVAEDGYLHCGDIGYDKFGRFDGTTFTYDENHYGSCIYDFAEYDGALYGSAYQGRMFRSANGINWSNVLGYYDGNMWELEVFQGLLFMSYNNGVLHSTDSTIARDYVWTAPDGIISMVAQGDIALYLGTGGEAGAYYGSSGSGTGKVYSYDGFSTPVAISGTLGVGIQCLYVQPVLPVDIDIKPGSDPNSINLDSAGVIPVAILGSDTFDASTVDPSTVCLAGASVKLIGKGSKYSASLEDVNGDGYLDLVCRIETASFLVESGASTAVLEAETYDGQRIRGEDTIRIVPPE